VKDNSEKRNEEDLLFSLTSFMLCLLSQRACLLIHMREVESTEINRLIRNEGKRKLYVSRVETKQVKNMNSLMNWLRSDPEGLLDLLANEDQYDEYKKIEDSL